MTLEEQGSPEDAGDVVQHQQSISNADRKRRTRTGRKGFRRGGTNKRTRSRRKDWTDLAFREPDDLDIDAIERVMPRDEGDRRRGVEQAVFHATDRGDADADATSADLGQVGLVMAVSGVTARVERGGQEVDCTVRGILTELERGFTNPVTVGDLVIVAEAGGGGWVAEQVLPRRTALTRPDPFLAPRQQVIAANVDQLLIVSSWREPDIWPELIDRNIIAAQRSEIEPLICVNKTDLIRDEADYRATLRPYDDLGHQVLVTSALEGDGVDDLRDALRDRTTVVVGLSGVGKSALLSAVQPELRLRTARVSTYSGQGRHTTSQSRLLRLDVGGYVADTPGIREFGLTGLTRVELSAFFPEIAAMAPGCRFSNCSHMAEPDCAVRAAEDSGEIPISRVHSYRIIWEELEA